MLAVGHYRLVTGYASASTFFCGKPDAPIHESGFSDAPDRGLGGEARRLVVNFAKLPELLRREDD